MTNEQIIAMAQEAGLMQVHSCCNVPGKLCNLDVWQGNIQAFFALAFEAGAANERETCAKVCDDGGRVQIHDHYTKGMSHASRLLAAAIRAR